MNSILVDDYGSPIEQRLLDCDLLAYWPIGTYTVKVWDVSHQKGETYLFVELNKRKQWVKVLFDNEDRNHDNGFVRIGVLLFYISSAIVVNKMEWIG